MSLNQSSSPAPMMESITMCASQDEFTACRFVHQVEGLPSLCACYKRPISLESANVKAHLDLRRVFASSQQGELGDAMTHLKTLLVITRDDPSDSFYCGEGAGLKFHVNRKGYINCTGARTRLHIVDVLCDFLPVPRDVIDRHVVVDNRTYKGEIGRLEGQRVDLTVIYEKLYNMGCMNNANVFTSGNVSRHRSSHFVSPPTPVCSDEKAKKEGIIRYIKLNNECFPGLIVKFQNGYKGTLTLFANGRFTIVGVQLPEDALKIGTVLASAVEDYFLDLDASNCCAARFPCEDQANSEGEEDDICQCDEHMDDDDDCADSGTEADMDDNGKEKPYTTEQVVFMSDTRGLGGKDMFDYCMSVVRAAKDRHRSLKTTAKADSSSPTPNAAAVTKPTKVEVSDADSSVSTSDSNLSVNAARASVPSSASSETSISSSVSFRSLSSEAIA